MPTALPRLTVGDDVVILAGPRPVAKDRDGAVEASASSRTMRTRNAIGMPSQWPRPRPPISPIEIRSAFIPVTEPTKPAYVTFTNGIRPRGSATVRTACSWSRQSQP